MKYKAKFPTVTRGEEVGNQIPIKDVIHITVRGYNTSCDEMDTTKAVTKELSGEAARAWFNGLVVLESSFRFNSALDLTAYTDEHVYIMEQDEPAYRFKRVPRNPPPGASNACT